MIKAVIWDVGGVMLFDDDIRLFWKDIPNSKPLRKEFRANKISVNEFINKGSKLFGITTQEFLKKYKETYFSVTLIPETFEIYKKMITPKYIFSNTNPIYAEFVLKTYPEIYALSKKNYLSHEMGVLKEGPEVFDSIIKEIGLLPSEILFIDDHQEKTEFAKIAGMNVIHYQNQTQLKKELKDLKVK